MNDTDIARRKTDHIQLALEQGERRPGVATGFETVRFAHCALPELALGEVDVTARLLGHALKAPLLISSMTGGPAEAGAVNARLAEAAQELGIALAVGSQRVALEGGGEAGFDRRLRGRMPGVPLLANLGAAQLNLGYGADEARRAVEMIGADALIIHLNPLQEAVQPEGDRDWRGLLAAITRLVPAVPVPVVVKEVGAGISGAVARRLVEAGVRAIDVAGAGGTSWAEIEAGRTADPHDRAVAMTFADWGIPTAIAIRQVRAACPGVELIGSGGLRTGLDVAKAIRLGADVAGLAAGFLRAGTISTEAVVATGRRIIQELRIACFCTGSANLAALRQAELVPADPGAVV